MTREQARKNGYCDHCAAFYLGKQLCVILAEDKGICQLDLETQQRWDKEYGLRREYEDKEKNQNSINGKAGSK